MHKPMRVEIFAPNGLKAIVFGGRLQHLLGPAKAMRFVAFFAGEIEATCLRYALRGQPFDGPASAFYVDADGDFKWEVAKALGEEGIFNAYDQAFFWECVNELRGIWFESEHGDSLPVFDVAIRGRELSVMPAAHRPDLDLLVYNLLPQTWRTVCDMLLYDASLLSASSAKD
jgi:hypothetical protein